MLKHYYHNKTASCYISVSEGSLVNGLYSKLFKYSSSEPTLTCTRDIILPAPMNYDLFSVRQVNRYRVLETNR